MEDKLRIEKANEVKAIIDGTIPITKWHFTSNVWTKTTSDKMLVRVYVNDAKGRRAAAVIIIDDEGRLQGQWQSGHSLTRNELAAALSLSL